ncbi:hypothetical protein [Neisseria weixii]|uniref:hypothetical protein n=1 Tax=Neisseria weixii TaxID=1853276 RepID=UPI001E490490|nr:hypothetical protein [Neisseria weixii]
MKNQDIEFYEEMKEKYKNDVGMLVTFAGDQGDIAFLQELAETGRFNPLATTLSKGGVICTKLILEKHAPYQPSAFTWTKA